VSQPASTVVETSRLTFKDAFLPDGWRWVRCQDVLDVRDGTHDTPKYVSEGVPLITSKNLKNGSIDFSSALFISREDHEQIKKRSCVHKGDILFAMIGTIGNPVIVNTEIEFSIKNVALFKPSSNEVLTEYFFWLLQSPPITEQLVALTQGGIQKFISLAALRNLRIPLPSLSLQKRIAAILKEQITAVERARAAAKTQLKAAKELAGSYLREVFNNPEAEHWQARHLSELASPKKYSIKRGPFGGHLKKEIFVSSGFKVYEQGNAIKNDFSLGTYYITDQKYAELEAFKVQPGDVIISCSGTIGKAAVVPDDAEAGIINQALLKVSLNGLILPKFFKLLFESDHIRKQLQKLSYGSGLENVASVGQLKLVTFPTPAVATQARIIKLHEERLELTSQLLKSSQDQLDSINNLPASLLRQAFTGRR
jgi:type I restriction enzyme, S subunit